MKQYSTILADPPWQTKTGRPLGGYKTENGRQLFANGFSNQSRALAYPTLSVESICAMPVRQLASADAHLYLWTTNQYLLKASEVINAWGFKYSTALVWAKQPMGGGLGGNFKITTEFLLFATRGSLRANEQIIGTWFQQKRAYKKGKPCHSKKPEFFHKLIERVSPGPHLELFARSERPGWDVFGNEVSSAAGLDDFFQLKPSPKGEGFSPTPRTGQ